MAEQKKVGFWLGMGIVFVPIIFAWFTLRKGHSVLSRVLAMGWLFLSFLVIATPSTPKPEEAPKAEPQAVAVVVSEPRQEIASTPAPVEPEQKDTLKRLGISDKDVVTSIDRMRKVIKSPAFAYTIKRDIVMQGSGFKAHMLHFENNFFIQMVGDKENTNNLTEISFMFHASPDDATNTAIIAITEWMTTTITKEKEKASDITLGMIKENMNKIGNKNQGIIENTKKLNGYKLKLTTMPETETAGLSFFTITKE